ncbi:type II secretion system protein GspC [Vibrio mangrovi]|uniref:Type II secretion system protein C n=1 Tax=Vibrio mangrovi TaxID=474394 RepID=A0A1Y6J0M5_9VIBR|nr:type II secretion system protein GspC [Vibrio mangrovi]MDW6002632.1 type II secretion system protein GspC [Vibrio mangrovi]SMS02791.1 Type II secretion system protein C [Vibrio mangrovi]
MSLLRSFTHYQPLLSTIVSVGIWLGAVWVFGQLVWAPFETVQVASWKPSSLEQHGSVDVFDGQFVKNKKLFGEVQKQSEKTVVRETAVNAPKTKLNLKLVGVVVSDNNREDLAIIAFQGVQATYGLKERIEGTRVTLESVFNDRVIIRNAGRDETLMLEDVEYSRLDTTRAQIHPSEPAPAPDDFVNYESGERSTQSERLDEIKQEIADNPQVLFQYVRLSQMKRDDDIIGYRLSPGRSPELFRSVGLQNGDIAIRLNDVDLRQENAMPDITKVLSDLSDVKITVERDGQTHDIYIQF